MSIVIVIAPHPDMGHTAWANLQQAGVLQAAPSRRERLTPLQIHELMLKTAQQRLRLVDSSSGGLSPVVPTLEKLWTELATDLMLANVDAAHYGWQQELDAHTPAFWHRLDPEARFVMVYEDPVAHVARATIAAKEQRSSAPEPLEDLLAQWHASHALLLDTFYAMNGNAVLVHATESAGAADFIGLPMAPHAKPVNVPSAGVAPTLLRQLLQPMVQQHSQAHALWLELQAVAQCPAAQPASDVAAVFKLVGEVLDQEAELQNANMQCSDLRQQSTILQQELNAEAAARQREAAAKAELLQKHELLAQSQKALEADLAQNRKALADAQAAHEAAQKAAQAKLAQQAQDIAALTQARDAEAKAQAQRHSEQLAAEKARLAEQHSQALRETQEEAELLLTQLHLVQEELENSQAQLAQQAQDITALTQARDAQAKAKAELLQKHELLAQSQKALEADLAQHRKALADAQAAHEAAQKAAQAKLAQQAQDMTALTQARDAEAKAQAQRHSEQLAAEKARLAEQHSQALRETQEEAELLLTQLHQVQEELENYFLKYQEQNAEAKAKAELLQKHELLAQSQKALEADLGSIRKLNYVPESPVMRRRRCRWPRRMPIRGK